MIFAIMLGLAVHVSKMSISIPSRTAFSGIVYASPGVPVSGAMVVASGTDGYGYDKTNPLGQYSITEGLKTGNYTVMVNAEGYLNEEIEGVLVEVGQETSGINFDLRLSGGISGMVTDAVSGAPLQNIVIVAFSPDGVGYGWQAVSDANGKYSIITNLATGTYNVSVLFPEGYIMETIGGIDVTAGVEKTGVNLALERSGTISGRITATPSGTPLENAMVTATSEDEKYVGFTQTNATGHYRISNGLGTGTYTVFAMYGMNFGQVEDVSVVAGAETPNVDIEIAVSPPPPSGIITGKVTDDITGKPIVGALVTAQGPAGSGEAHTDKNGNYAISSGLETGTYTVVASALGYSPKQVTGVSVTAGLVTPDINFQLSRIPPAESGRISGTVQGDPNPIPEFPHPISILLVAALVAVALTKLFSVKALDAKKLQP